MSGRIEHDDDAVLLRLVVCDLCASRYGVVEQLEEAGASIRSIPQVVHGDVQVHAHLLLAGDGRPYGRYERLLPLELKLFDLSPGKWTTLVTIWPCPSGAIHAKALSRRASAADL